MSILELLCYCLYHNIILFRLDNELKFHVEKGNVIPAHILFFLKKNKGEILALAKRQKDFSCKDALSDTDLTETTKNNLINFVKEHVHNNNGYMLSDVFDIAEPELDDIIY